MRADVNLERLGQGGEHPSSLEARAGAFLYEARATTGLSETDIAVIERRLLRGPRPRPALRLFPVLAALAVLLVGGSVLAVVGGWRPRLPFIERSERVEPSPDSPGRTPLLSHKLSSPTKTQVEPLAAHSATDETPDPPALGPGARTQASVRRVARLDNPPAREPAEVVSMEARSLAAALARWRRDGDALAALELLDAHEHRFPRGALSIEARVARAEILLALGQREQALRVLDSLDLAALPRARELLTIRGELRAQAGRCRAARADLSPVAGGSDIDGLGKRASRALAKCP